MINMGHCRFENTFFALCECIFALINNDWDELPESEIKYAKKLEDKCKEYIEKFSEKRSIINNF